MVKNGQTVRLKMVNRRRSEGRGSAKLLQRNQNIDFQSPLLAPFNTLIMSMCVIIVNGKTIQLIFKVFVH